MNELTLEDKEHAIDNFIDIIKFKTISNLGITGEYINCAEWLVKQLNLIGLDNVQILPESKDKKPIVVASFLGSKIDLPQILLNSHYDVVPIMEDLWTVPAFEGFRRDGRIYGRGTQDMKCVCVQYIIALKKLKEQGFIPKRTIHLSFVPDEEIGGADGMNILMQTTWFSNINIAIALDEGLASENDDYSVFYGERLPWWIRVTSKGNTGHASRFIEGTAVEQIIGVANKALAFREEQKDLLHGKGKHYGCSHAIAAKKNLGDVTTLNMTVLRAGVSAGGVDVLNVIPSEAEAGFDIRISPLIEPCEMAAKLTFWCEEVTTATSNSNASTTWEFINDGKMEHALTSIDPTINKWYALFQDTLLNKCRIKIQPSVFPAATDSRFLRACGVRAFGFSPMRNSPILLHEHDEYLDEHVFIEGCQVYITLLRELSSQEEL